MPECSVIIPAYNKASLTQQCLDTLLALFGGRSDVEVIVVNDGSGDLTAHILARYGEKIRVVSHQTNKGFATTCNDGAAAASGEYVVFLNNDTIPQPGWLDSLLRYARNHPQAAAVGSKMLFPNNTIQHAGVVICHDRDPRHIYSGFPADHPAVNRSRRFQIVTAGCALFRRRVFEEVGGFDTAFFNGYEDVDLCLRLGARGYEIHYCHESVLYHLESVVTDSMENRSQDSRRNLLLYRSRWGDRVRPDDFLYYIDDGLVSVDYRQLYPVELTVSPQVALLSRDGRQWEADRLLMVRSRQVSDLLRENIRLHVRVQEAELEASHAASNGTPSASARPKTATAEPRLLATGTAHWLSSEASGRLISVILPVKNAAARLRELLPSILKQRSLDLVEFVAVDSGSADDTVEVLREFAATVVAIEPQDFNHGLTRKLAAEYAQGDVFVFLNKSTQPADERWLANLVAPLDHDPMIAGVCSRVLPRPDADPLTRKDALANPHASPERHVRSINNWDEYKAMPPHPLRLFLNFHSLSTAIRPDVFRKIPFRKVLIGEDLLWAKEVLEAGYKLQHEPSSVVYHSHRFSYLETLQINFDDGVANREFVGRQFRDADLVPWTAQMIRQDWKYLEDECRLQGPDLEYWRLVAVLRRAAQGLGQWIGVNGNPATGELMSVLSMIHRLKAGVITEAANAWEF
jgi:GT2 family glycosyltransferase